MSEPEEAPWSEFAKGECVCPVCGEQVPVIVLAQLYVDDEGKQRLRTEPQMDDLYSHMWTHEEVV